MSILPNDSTVRSIQPFFGSGNRVNDILRKLNQMIIYDPSVVSLTSGPNVLADIFDAAKTVATSKRPYFFRFFINPTNVGFSIRKIVLNVLEKKGWDSVHFAGTPNEMLVMKFSGSTGSLVPPIALWEAGILDTKFSVNYQRFMQLHNLIYYANNDLKLFYDGRLYEGVIKDFTFDESGEAPFGIKYSFTFNAYPERTRNIAAFDSSSIPVARNTFQAGIPI